MNKAFNTMTNFETGIVADVHLVGNGAEVHVLDFDASKIVGVKKFATLDAAQKFALACVADVMPANTWMTI